MAGMAEDPLLVPVGNSMGKIAWVPGQSGRAGPEASRCSTESVNAS